jgi:hypothetical protein
MEYPVQRRCCDDRVPHDLSPLAVWLVRREDGRHLLVPSGYQLEEQVRAFPLHRKVSDLIDDEELVLAEGLELPVQHVALLRLPQLVQERRCCRVVDREAAAGRLDAEAYRQMGLAHARRPEEAHALRVMDELQRPQLLDDRLVD